VKRMIFGSQRGDRVGRLFGGSWRMRLGVGGLGRLGGGRGYGLLILWAVG